MSELIKVVFVVIGVMVTIAGLGLLLAWPIMWCWNYAVVSIFGLPAITWGKAWCLSFLSGCFIKSTLTTTK